MSISIDLDHLEENHVRIMRPVLEGARGAAVPGPQIKKAPSQVSTNSIVCKIF
jgi:hypothetical protein